MRKVSLEPHKLSEDDQRFLVAWKTRATIATRDMLDALAGGIKENEQPAVWGDLKRWLLAGIFNGKCAYCESRYVAVTYGAADHHRPKGRVTVLTGDVRVPVGGHEGYFWLKYVLENLVPACDRCNSGKGKGDLFPVLGVRIYRPENVPRPYEVQSLNDLEEPLLLHPYFDDPTAHLIFGAGGVVAARASSKRGMATIEICRLDREELMADRRSIEEQIRTALLDGMYQHFNGYATFSKVLVDIRSKYCGPQAAFTAAASDAIDRELALLTQNMAG